MVITNRQLTDTFLSPQMRCYFERKLRDVLPSEVGARIEEALKFLNIAAHCDGSIPVTQDVDDIWHYWILETREYERLCRSLSGGAFIHHRSNTYAECDGLTPDALQNEFAEDVAALGTYVVNYGPFERDRVRYWLLAAHLTGQCGMTLDQLNQWLLAGVTAGAASQAPAADAPPGRPQASYASAILPESPVMHDGMG